MMKYGKLKDNELDLRNIGYGTAFTIYKDLIKMKAEGKKIPDSFIIKDVSLKDLEYLYEYEEAYFNNL